MLIRARVLRMASDSDNSYSIRVTNARCYHFHFTAQVFSFDISVGGVDDITSIACDLEIDGTIFRGVTNKRVSAPH